MQTFPHMTQHIEPKENTRSTKLQWTLQPLVVFGGLWCSSAEETYVVFVSGRVHVPRG